MTAQPPARPTGAPAPGAYRLREVYLFLPVALAALGLGAWGFLAARPNSACHAAGLGDALFRALLLTARSFGNCPPAVGLPPQLLAAQLLLPLLLVLGTIFAGVKLAFGNLRHDAKVAMIRATRGHTIVCGLGETGLEAIRQLAAKRGMIVAICLDAHEPGAKICERLGAAVIAGDASLAGTLAAAGIAHARAVIMCTGSDARNMEICLAVNAMLPASRKPGAGPKLFPELRGSWLMETLGLGHAPLVNPALELHPFRANQIIARALLRNPAFRAAGAAPCLIFLGFGDLAAAILRQAVLSNYALPGVAVHAIGLDAVEPAGAGAWAGIATSHTITHRFGEDEAADEAALRGALAGPRQTGVQLTAVQPTAVIVTLPGDDLALATAVLARRVLDVAGYGAVPVFARVRDQSLLGRMLGTLAAIADCPDRLTGFGDLSNVVAPDALFDEQLDTLARAVHETYLASSSGDSPARVPWPQLAERYRRSSRLAADHIATKLAFTGYVSRPGPQPGAALDEAAIEAMAQAEHYRWCLTLYANGWRHDAARSELRRTHPLLVRWEDLPEQTRADNRAEIAAIPRILARIGQTIARVD